jgi:hypothetical protein
MVEPVMITTMVVAFLTLLSQVFGHMKSSSCKVSDCLETKVENKNEL